MYNLGDEIGWYIGRPYKLVSKSMMCEKFEQWTSFLKSIAIVHLGDFSFFWFISSQPDMSQFQGYTVDISLKGQEGRTIRGIISNIVNRDITLKNPVYVKSDGSYEKANAERITLPADTIADLNVIELAKESKQSRRSKKSGKNEQNDNNIKENTEEKTRKSKGKANGNANGNGNEKFDAPIVTKYVDIYNEKPKRVDSQSKKSIQLEEFDFASNLEKFDKQSIFKSISESDNVEQSDRLVSFNKVDNVRKGKSDNYDNSEMVLKKKSDAGWDDNNEYNYSNVVGSSANSKVSGNSFPSSKSDNISKDSLNSRQTSNISLENNRKASITSTFAQFHSKSHGEAPIPTCSTLQLSEIFHLCNSKFDIDNRILIENSSRSICDVIINRVIGNFRISLKNHNEPPVILAVVGNNKAGAISIATARQLFNRGFKLVLYLLYDSENSQDELLNIVDQELKRYSNFGGKIVTKLSQLNQILHEVEKNPLELILDGLQGFDNDINELEDVELKQASELINWCNDSKVPIMSIDIPTGLNPSSGTFEGEEDSMIINSKYVVSIGLALSSTLNMYKFGYFEKGQVGHFLIECGIPRRLFGSKGTLRRFDRRWFAETSSIDLNVA